MTFDVVGDRDPFLHVKLRKGESCFAESGAMVSMDATLDLDGEIRGGVLSGLARRLVAEESLFTQKFTASRGDGEALLAPAKPGDIQILDVSGSQQFLLNDGAFLAAEPGVELRTRMQRLGQALFGGTGGFFVVETAGTGRLAVNGFGSLFSLTVQPGHDLIIDNQHVVAWSSSLTYTVSLRTSARRGFLGSLVNSATSGEGVVTRFSGSGQVLLASRNFTQLRDMLAPTASAGAQNTNSFRA